MRKVIKLHGPPGTGKTTWLMREMEAALRAGVAPERIGFVSFSRRAIEEARTRARQITDADLPHFRTIHSTAYHIQGLGHGDVLQAEHLEEFGEMIGLPCAPPSPEGGVWEGAVGSRCLGFVALAAARGTTVEDEWERAAPDDLPWELVSRTAECYRRYKAMRSLSDFNDMIVNAVGTLEVDVLFVDEAQDTSAAQWKFLRYVARDVPTVYLAGDDDQAIYAWSGADPVQLLRLRGESLVLPVSYRLPRAVKQLADSVVQRIHTRVAKSFQARKAEGRVEWTRELDHVDLHDGATWLLMARSNYQLRQFREWAQMQGVVYSLPNGEWSWSLPAVRAAVTYEALRSGGSVPRGEARGLEQFSSWVQRAPGEREQCGWGEVFGSRPRSRPWMEALDLMTLGDREYIRALRRSKESLHQPGRVRISTVHGAKGTEAQHVVLLTDISEKVQRAAQVDPDAERRVQYVAVTRAKESLTLVQPRTVTFWDF